MKTCKRGHPWTKANTYIIPGSGNKMCRECKRERDATYNLKKRGGTEVWKGPAPRHSVYLAEARDQLLHIVASLKDPITILKRYVGPVALIVPKNVSKSAMLKAWEEMQK